MMAAIPVMRPKLPSADRLVPYLRNIDRARIYSNYGPLVLALEERLSVHFGLEAGTVASVSNATLGLMLALAAQGVRPGGLCAIPAWTFVASAHAAAMAGLIPFFIDVDADTWALDPERIADVIASAPGEVGAVMPVAPFGRPIDVAAWDAFHSRTGVPVVIDAAAGFDGLRPGAVPAVVSLHATKVLGVGEGGFVISTDDSLIESIRTRSNFGFSGSREAVTPAVNAKLSEYHAAIGLAALDEWGVVREEWMAVARNYREAALQSNRLRFQDGFGESWIASTCVIRLMGVGLAEAEAITGEAGAETRRWWGRGAHAHPATAAFPRTPVSVTEQLAESTIGLPFFRDLGAGEIRQIGELVHAADRAW
jgi:dTDP-4-amino-4,6-dideoxygalactose transaminase